jgi:uncharacterized protein (DUF433 family)
MISIDTLLTSSPEIRHGRPRIAGTGITVHRIAICYKLGYGVEEIRRKYPHLSLAGIYAALTYYHANQTQIDAEIAADEAEANQLEQTAIQVSP